MTALERWSLHLGAFLTALSGVAYGWLRYFGRAAGEFGLEPHPLQALAQHLHVLAAPVLLFALGMAVRGHLAAKLRARAPDWLKPFESLVLPEPHPLLRMVPGGVADWEVRGRASGTDAPTPRTSRPPRT